MNLKSITPIILFLLPQFCLAQIKLSGRVLDKENNKPIESVNVIITNTTNGTITDKNGYFQLVTDDTISSLTFSCVGYQTVIIKEPDKNIVVNLSPEVSELDEVVIKSIYTKPVKKTSDVIYTGSAITNEGIKLMGVSASSSVYNAIDLMPGIDVEGSDTYGLSEKSVRIRSIKDNFSGMTIEGFPNYGIMPIGARDDIYNMKNMKQIAVYKGAIPADLGTATGSKGGAIEIQYRRPGDKFEIQLQQAVGSDNYTCSFARIDFPLAPTKTGVFLSYSYTQADKWKGPGKLGPRKNAAIGIVQRISKNTMLEIFANYNQTDRHDFRSLNFEQAKDLNTNYQLDYNPSLTGDPSQDMYYFDYNGGKFTNKDLMSTLSHTLGDDHKINLKYYLSAEDADYNEGLQKGPAYFLFNRERVINRTGIIPELSGQMIHINYSVGYWFESNANNAFVYSSRITQEGPEAIGYSNYAVKDSRGQVHSPYLKLAHTYKKFSFQAGIKYFYYMDPETERYASETPTELSDTPDPNLHTDKMSYGALLPTLGIGFNFNDKLEAYVNYGKNYMRPYMYSPIISLYIKNQEIFTDNGMSLQSIFDRWKMETSDHIDIGFRYHTGKITLSPSVFYALHHNVLASAYDPVVELDYYQNVGELTAHGADIECYFFPVKNLMLYLNPTYNSMTYNNDLYRKNDTSSEGLGIKGNQAPASPRLFVKSGFVYSIWDVDFSARAKYIGKRYGDVTNTEEISAYVLVDASVKYSRKNLWKIKELCVAFELKNIFNEKYIGMIDVSDDSVQGNASYYAGAPFSMIGSLCVNF